MRKPQRKYKPLPSQEYLKKLFDYEATGILTWRNCSKPHLNGSVAGSPDKEGYWQVGFDGEIYRVHRLIWMWVHGEDPKEMDIDHIDGVPNNNRIDNLRVVTRTVNNRNLKKYKNNTSGCTGVWSWEYADGKNWIAEIGKWQDRQSKRFYTREDAVEQRLAWEKELDYTGRCHINEFEFR